VTLVPRDQRALLRMERSLRKDPAVKATLETFTYRCHRGKGPTREPLSPWHPVLWPAVFLVLVALTVSFGAVAAVAVMWAN
jgi:Protein of unknown function (DUF3040)